MCPDVFRMFRDSLGGITQSNEAPETPGDQLALVRTSAMYVIVSLLLILSSPSFIVLNPTGDMQYDLQLTD
jgi:hypothetical protein